MPANVFILMGVSATGKTTLGNALAHATQGQFLDGDDFHPEANRIKMAAGNPLNDQDRQPWLNTLASLIAQNASLPRPSFLACSALKESYRETLRSLYPPLVFLHLVADPAILLQRITERYESGEHFMPPSLLGSQLNTLEIPEYALELDVSKPIDELVEIFLTNYPGLSGA